MTNNQSEFGIYRISRDYINHLRSVEPQITNPDKTTIYCGPVYRATTKRGQVDYFVPIDVDYYTSHHYFMTSFIDGIFAYMMDFNKMIPCLPSERKLDESKNNLTEFCRANKNELCHYAKLIYETTHN